MSIVAVPPLQRSSFKKTLKYFQCTTKDSQLSWFGNGNVNQYRSLRYTVRISIYGGSPRLQTTGWERGGPGTWRQHSHDLTSFDFFRRQHSKSRVYSSSVDSLKVLNRNITAERSRISYNTLKSLWHNTESRRDFNEKINGGHVKQQIGLEKPYLSTLEFRQKDFVELQL